MASIYTALSSAPGAAMTSWQDPVRSFLPDVEFDFYTLTSSGFLLAVAFVLALPVGWEREQTGRSAGLRTFPLVALSSCAYVLVSIFAFGDGDDARSRVLEGLITGIGFVGGGAILKSNDRVSGTATATSVWTTGAIGASVAYGRLDIAVLLSAVTFATLRWLHRIDGSEDPEGAPSASGDGGGAGTSE